MLPTTSRYISLAEFLLVAATFAGSITSAAILTTPTLPEYVRTLLGYASALFLSSVTGIFPLILVLQRFQDDQAPDNGYYWVVITGLVVAALAVGAAFIILIVALRCYISEGAFILGALAKERLEQAASATADYLFPLPQSLASHPPFAPS